MPGQDAVAMGGRILDALGSRALPVNLWTPLRFIRLPDGREGGRVGGCLEWGGDGVG